MGSYCFGIDVGGTTVKCGLFQTDGNLVDKWEIPTRTENKGENILPDVAKAIQEKMSDEKNIVLKIEDNSAIFPRISSVEVKNVVKNQTVKIFQYGKPDTSIGDDASAGQLLAFPGAEGGGRFTTGGRNGEINKAQWTSWKEWRL